MCPSPNSLVFTEKLVAKFIRRSKPTAHGAAAEKQALLVNAAEDSEPAPEPKRSSPIMFAFGVLASILGGVAAATQYGVVTQGKKEAEHHYGCSTNTTTPLNVTTTLAPSTQCTNLKEVRGTRAQLWLSPRLGARRPARSAET